MKIFKIISLITFIVLISSREVDGQAVEWVNSVTGSAIDTYISTDAVGNNYITGRFTGTTTFGTTTLTNYNGSVDIFIAKYDNAGNSLWVKQAGGTSNDVGYGIAVDATGNSYITGFFQGTATFGITTLTSITFHINIDINILI